MFGALDDRRVVFVVGKGGVGKSTVATALAVALAESGKRVLLAQMEPSRRLAEFLDIPAADRDDPVYRRTGGVRLGRDGCRVPMPWSGTAAPYGFTEGDATWLPQPSDWAALTVAAQRADDGSRDAAVHAARQSHRHGQLHGPRGCPPPSDEPEARYLFVWRHGL